MTQHTERGVLLARSGERAASLPLPRDGMGEMLDEKDLPHRIGGVLRLLLAVDAPLPNRFVVALACDR